MYNAEQIKSELIGLIGWRQNVDPTGWQLTEMTSSSTGLWFNSIHPLLTIENLISVCPRFDVLHSGDQAAINAAFTKWLKEKTEDAIIQAVDAWIDEKFEVKTVGNLLEHQNLFNAAGDFSDTETSTGKVVGMEIVPTRSKSMIVELLAVGFQFEENESFDLKLFKSGMKVANESESIVYDEEGTVKWVNLGWILEGEGAYYLVYNQDDVNGNAINGVRDYTWANKGLTSFPSGRYFKATALNVDSDMVELWDLSDNHYSVSTNYGMNLKFSVRCDYTSFIIDQKNLFKSVIAYQVGINLLREIALNSSSRINNQVDNVDRTQVLYEIDGDTRGDNSSTLYGRYKKALKAIAFDDNRIDKVCLPCRKRGMRHSSIGTMRS